MTSRDKLGVVVLLLLFVLFGVALYFTVRPKSTERRGFGDNVLVEQRMINLQKSKE